MTIKIITIGAAIQDVYLSGRVLTPVKEHDGWDMELPLGSKMEVENITFSTGGGATNAAVTFARQGLDCGYLGKVGRDPAGEAIIKELRQEGVSTELISFASEHQTGYSVLLLAPNGERTILTYRGASTDFNMMGMTLNRAHADWFYVSSLAGDLEALETIVNDAHSRHIKVALNPGEKELEQADRLISLLPKISLLSLNKSEMQKLFEGGTIQDLVKAASRAVPLVAVTDGPNGSAASDGQTVCSAGMYDDVPVIDRTGAGDAFASAFTSAMAKGGTLQDALKLASANSTSVVTKIGAKAGILPADYQLHEMEIYSEPREGNV